MKKLILIFLLSASIQTFGQIDSLRAHFAAGQEAYKAGDFQSFLNEMLISDKFRPYYPPVMYNIAAGYSLIGETSASGEHLKNFLSTNATIAIEEDTDFQNLKAESVYRDVVEVKARLSESVSNSREFQSITGTTHIESIAIDPVSGLYYLGDVRDRKIYIVKNENIESEIVGAHPDFYSVMGLDMDQKNGLLWICTAALPQMTGYVDSLDSHSSLFSYSLKSGKLTHHATLRSGATFGDLIVKPKGEVLISDGNSNRVYSYFPKVGLVLLADLSRQIYNLQGLALSEDQKTLFVSDYISGLYRFNFADKSLEKLGYKSGTPFKGIDGLYVYKNALIGIENGSKPVRVVQFELSGSEITGFKILDQNLDFLNEPTQGVVLREDFIFISNSPWSRYDRENTFTPATDPIQLRKVSLNDN